ncbi:cell wall-binding repeat-containing protein [Bifidobacterium pongonis]|uniref:cell wall-binding repeat-containing protein n=1 Tax=Bifidobacterium pongonis TaxID=2834432 RepID=UPI003B8339D8
MTQYTALGVDGAVFATGQNYPDVLVARPLAGAQDSLLILVGSARKVAHFGSWPSMAR